MARGFVYLTAVVDWATRKILAYRVAITLEAAHAVEALEEAFARYGQPEIVNTDQGSLAGRAVKFTGAIFDALDEMFAQLLDALRDKHAELTE